MPHVCKIQDRLLGNGQLYSERISIYSALSKCVIGGKKRISVLVDWSPCAEHDNQILKASLAMKDRSITLYEEVHPEKHLGKEFVHKHFLESLKQVLPKGVEVLIVTDAGFRTQWFKLVLNEGWDFEGRIRTNMQYSSNKGQTWHDCKSLYKKANSKAKYIGQVYLTKKNKLSCQMYLYKGMLKKSKKKISTQT